LIASLAAPIRAAAYVCQEPGFAGHPAYGITQLREDLERFVFLPGADDEPLFGPQPSPPPAPAVM